MATTKHEMRNITKQECRKEETGRKEGRKKGKKGRRDRKE